MAESEQRELDGYFSVAVVANMLVPLLLLL